MLKNIVERVIPELTEDVLEIVSKRVLTVGVGASLEPSFRPQYCSIIRALLRKKRAVALAMEERLRLAPVQLSSCILLDYAHAAGKSRRGAGHIRRGCYA